MPNWLADELVESLASMPGSVERDHVVGLLRRARLIQLSEASTRAVARTVKDAGASIERNLDRLLLDEPVVWLEYSHRARSEVMGVADESKDVPVRVGCLVACNPDDHERIAIFVAWKLGDGRIFNSYALLHWNRAEFLDAAAAAPRRDDGKSAERIMGLARTFVPPGFEREMLLLNDFKVANDPRISEALLQTQRDAMGEHVFLLAAMLYVQSTAATLVPCTPEDDLPVVERPKPAANQNRKRRRTKESIGRRIRRSRRQVAPDFIPGDGEPDYEDAVETETEIDGRRVVKPATEAFRWPWQERGFRKTLRGTKLAWTDPAPC